MSSNPNATPATHAAVHTGDRRRGADLRTKIADSTLIQAVIAGALSFTHIRDVAVMGGQRGLAAWAYPFIVDLITMSAYRKLKHAQAGNQPTGAPWMIMIAGTLFSLAANVIDALAHAPAHATHARLTLCMIIGVWPAAAFICSMLLRHSGQPAIQPTTERPIVDQPPAVPPVARSLIPPTGRPVAPTVQQRPAAQRPTDTPPPIPVQPATLTDLGPRAAVGELPMPVWVEIGRPVYNHIKITSGGRPTEKMLQAALGQRVAELIAAGKLPAAVGQPSGSTAKRIRAAIEKRHPELTARTDQPQRLAIAPA